MGKIKDDKLIGTSDRVYWDLDISICIILRDLLRNFAKIYDNETDFSPCPILTEEGEPIGVSEVATTDEETDAKIFEKRRKWAALIRDIANHFNFYIQHDGYNGNKECTEKLQAGLELLGKHLLEM